MSDKRKNDAVRRLPGWQLLAAFILGALAMVLVFLVWGGPFGVINRAEPVEFAQATSDPAALDPFMLTATGIVAQATAQAGATQVPAGLDPFVLTATYFVAQATAAAAGN